MHIWVVDTYMGVKSVELMTKTTISILVSGTG